MYNANKEELEILKYWNEHKCFEKSVSERPENKPYVFYDGPPFATGLPHYGHILSSVIKDVVPRYWTMKGYRVRRRWGWDCHGMPIENIVEKELKISGKKDIEEKIGVGQFNATCRSKVLTYTQEWKKMVDRIGRWVEFDNAYKTMDVTYMESVWWALKSIWDKNLIYEGRKVLMYCPRCETPVSKAEVAMDDSYKDINEETVTVKFKIKDPAKYSLPENTFILAWTTTPWTLPGNVALAVGEDIEYVRVNILPSESHTVIISGGKTQEGHGKIGEGDYILAKSRVEDVFKNMQYEVVGEMRGKDLIGVEYEPLFDIPEVKLSGKKAWYVASADFVTTEDGTGVVHTAVIYGEDDYNLGVKIDLPMVPLLDEKGFFNEASPELIRGQYFKKAEKLIKDDLEKRELLFKREYLTHSYPHCWRCDTQLFYNAISAWFIDIQKVKSRLIELNQKINWVPDHLKNGRFLNILETAPDWNISRNRYWATPLPFWKCSNKDCDHRECIGSIQELKDKSVGDVITKLILVRHGHSEPNDLNIYDSNVNSQYHLTEAGCKESEAAAEKIASENPDVVIYTSPLLRTRETAEIIAKRFNISPIVIDGLKEVQEGNRDGKRLDDPDVVARRNIIRAMSAEERCLVKRGETGESWCDAENRIYTTIEELVDANRGKTIVVVGHQGPLGFLLKALRGLTFEETFQVLGNLEFDSHIYARPVNVFIDSDTKKEIDLHRPFIDKFDLKCSACGQNMQRISEVIDCWVESASMPFAEFHYPFENEEVFKSRFPGQYIAEYIAQTRAWFYYMHAIATLLFNNVSFENVVCTGTILNERGEKLSKSKRNFTDPWAIIEQYGVDSLRYYLMTSPVMQADDICFSDREVKDIYNKVINILSNVVEFYKMYGDKSLKFKVQSSKNILDKWIIAKTNLLVKEVTENMDKYDTVKAGRPIRDFIDDLSTWYVRRSRDRFKLDGEDKDQALATLHEILMTLSKVMAPFMPFMAEKIYLDLGGELESVHLEIWPEIKDIDNVVLTDMAKAREIVSLGLEQRSSNKVNVRQPLAKITAYGYKLSDEYLEVIKDELNVKSVELVAGAEKKVELDLNITDDLKREGLKRELTRQINNLRKEAGLTIKDQIVLYYETDDEVLAGILGELRSEVLAKDSKQGKAEVMKESELNIDEKKVWVGIGK